MATTNISTEIVSITGVSAHGASDEFIVSAQKFVAASIPKELLRWAASETVPSTHGGDDDPQQVTVPTGTDSIISVRRDSYVAQEVGIEARGFIGNSNSLNLATNTFPKYFVADANRIIVKPDPDSTYKIYVTYVDYSNLDDDSDLMDAVVYRACSSEYGKLATAALPTVSIAAVPPDVPSDPTISYTNASVGNSVSVAQDSINSAQDSITVGPTDAAGISDADAPTDAAGTGSTASTASAYTKPSVGGTATEITSVTALDVENAIDDFDGNSIEVDQWFATLAHLIEGEEDTELATAQLQKINSYINAFQAEVQSASAAMQASIEDARQSTQASIATAGDATRASMANASNDVSTNNASIASQTQASIANASNDVNASIAKMRESTGAATTKMQLSTQAAISQMSESTSVNVQNAARTMEALTQDYTLTMSKYTSELQQYASEVQAEVSEYQNKMQKSQILGKEADKYYQWSVNCVTMYIQNNSKMIAATMASRGAQA